VAHRALEKVRQLHSATLASLAITPSKTAAFRALPPHYEPWLRQTLPAYFQNSQGQPIPFADRHHELWQWVWALRAGQLAPSMVAIWPRGGGKSVTAEVAAATTGNFGLRRYGLYISATQRQADDHVANVAGMFAVLGINRALNQYGVSKGWRINRLRTADGFTLDAIGMDAAMRGARLDAERPDLIILDDLDDQDDTSTTIEKKINTLTRKILPSGSNSLVVLGVQNLPNRDGIFARLADGRAEFLLDRVVSGPFPALQGQTDAEWWERSMSQDGRPLLRITQGIPSWAGQNRADCEALLNKIGVTAFLVECQHQATLTDGAIFKRQWFRVAEDYPRQARSVRYWDLAATEHKAGRDPDWTAGAKVAEWQGQYALVDMRRTRGTPRAIESLIAQTAALDGKAVEIYIEQEPGSSGVAVIDHYQRVALRGYAVHGVRSTGPKATRARPAASAAEAGNFVIMHAAWNEDFLLECDGLTGHDDQIDAISGAFTALGDGGPAESASIDAVPEDYYAATRGGRYGLAR
jgi:predicted phage terminase large subunit-like protein